MSRTPRPESSEPGDPLDIGQRVAERRAEAQRSVAVRRRRRQTLPTIVVGSAMLAGVGVAGVWVNARMPKPAPVTVIAPADQTVTTEDQAAVDELERQLAAEQQSLQSLQAQTGSAAKAGATALSSGSAGPAAATPAVAAPRPVVRAVAKAPAPAAHATTGASHGK